MTLTIAYICTESMRAYSRNSAQHTHTHTRVYIQYKRINASKPPRVISSVQYHHQIFETTFDSEIKKFFVLL